MCVPGIHARTTRVLMLMVIPGHIIFIYTIRCMKAGHTSLSPLFVIVYLVAALVQVSYVYIGAVLR
jgi:solute carrier family 41